MTDDPNNPVNQFQAAQRALQTNRKQKELEHWHAWNEGGRTADLLHPLLHAFEPLVQQKVKQWKAPAVNEAAFRTDLQQKIFKAVETYDPNRGVALNTHVENMMRQSQRYNGNNQNMKRIPEAKAGLIGKIQRAQNTLREDYEREPTHEEIALHIGAPLKHVNSTITSMGRDIPSSRFEEDPTANAPMRNDEVLSLLPHELNARERVVFGHIFPEQGEGLRSTQEIAKKTGLSVFQVSRARTAILDKYRRFKLHPPQSTSRPAAAFGRLFSFGEHMTPEEVAKNKLMSRIVVGQEQAQKAIDAVQKMSIQDMLVSPKAMRFSPAANGRNLTIDYIDGRQVSIHRHALSQLAGRAEIPMGFINLCEKEDALWATATLCGVLEDFYQNKKFKFGKSERPVFLHRVVNEELRGFMSRRYNIHLATGRMVQDFVTACTRNLALPAEGIATDVRFSLKAFLNVPVQAAGEFLGVGVEFSNSDFGAGKMKVSSFLFRVASGGFISCDEGIARVHLGRILEDSDIDIDQETTRKEAEAIGAAIGNAVDALLKPDSLERLIAAIDRAWHEQIPWSSLQKRLSSLLGKDEIGTVKAFLDQNIETLPALIPSDQGVNTPTSWWVASVLGQLASSEKDPDRKLDLQKAAGSFLTIE